MFSVRVLSIMTKYKRMVRSMIVQNVIAQENSTIPTLHRWGEWVISRRGRICLITRIKTSSTLPSVTLVSQEIGDIEQSVCDIIPILGWETIRKILERAGILLRFRETPDGWVPAEKVYCDVTILHRDAAQVRVLNSLAVAPTYQKAVMEAVLKWKEWKK